MQHTIISTTAVSRGLPHSSPHFQGEAIPSSPTANTYQSIHLTCHLHSVLIHLLYSLPAGGANTGGLPLGGALGFLPVTNRGDNPPCNTLFIGNLSDTVCVCVWHVA